MKKKSKLFRLAIVFALCCIVIALLEIFALHPQFSIGSFHVYWAGVRQMDFQSGTMTIPLSGGRKEIQKDYDLGPFKVAIVHVS